MKMNRAERMKLNAKAETEELVTIDAEPNTEEKKPVDIAPDEIATLIEQNRQILAKVGVRGRPRKAEEDKLRGYRYSLNLDRDLNEFLHDIAWEKRTSITQYINDLIRADMMQHQAGGEVNEGTEDS